MTIIKLPPYDQGLIERINHKLGHDFPLILASASPRRAQILRLLGLKFTTIPSQAKEEDVPGSPEEKARAWAMLKAEAVASRLSGAIRASGSGRQQLLSAGVVIGADTIVVLEGQILGKPRDEQEARKMLKRLSGCKHRVISGLAVINTASGQRIIESVESWVSFRTLSEDEIESYIASREPMDKAGAYGIQGRGASFVIEVEGCYTNVVGLPVSCLLKSLSSVLSLTSKDNHV